MIAHCDFDQHVAFNRAVHHMEARVRATARKLETLDTDATDRALITPPVIETTPRIVS